MNNFAILSELGLSDKEVKVYLALLEFGSSLASTISRKIGLKRPTVYMILESLRQRGFVTTHTKAKITYFKAIDPDILVEHYYSKYSMLKDAVPELKMLNKMFQVKPHVSVYEGTDGLKRMMEDTLTTDNGELLVWSDINLAWHGPISDYFPEYVKKRVEKKILVRGIFTESEAAQGFKDRSELELRDVRLIPPQKFPFKNEVNIYNNKVNIISFKDEIGVMIENQAIADTQKSIFLFAWEYANLLDELKSSRKLKNKK